LIYVTVYVTVYVHGHKRRSRRQRLVNRDVTQVYANQDHCQSVIYEPAAGLARSVTDQLRTCDIVAKSDVSCWELRVEDFMEVVSTDVQVPQKSPVKRNKSPVELKKEPR